MFSINDDKGIAWELTEGGMAKYNPASDDFNILMSAEEAKEALSGSTRCCSADEALDFARAKTSSSTISRE